MTVSRACSFAIVIASLWGCGAASPSPAIPRAGASSTGVTSKQSSPPPPTTPTVVAPAPTCSERMLPVAQASLQSIAREPRIVVDRTSLPTVSPDARSVGELLSTACPVLVVSATSVSLDGVQVNGADDAARARAIASQWRAMGRRRPRPRQLCVAAPAELPLARIESLVGRLERVVLLAVPPPTPAATSPSPWADETLRTIGAMPPEGRCQAYREVLERAAGACVPARAALRELIDTTPACTVTPTDGAGVRESALVIEALTACHCGGADIAAIIRLYGRAADRVGTTLRAFPLHGQLYPGVPSLDENYRQPITVLDRVRQLEREEGFQPD